ncbi:MAG: NAD-dependent epimerase/dehydratase family protein, partial [Actinomycetota bacterium]|nr:NAD-dependent epimerase/dehydratase family protein [Actinomycetota bacterium]
MKVLLTGVSGYVGSLLVDRLQREGHEVRGMSRRPPAGGELEVIRADAVSGAGLERALHGVDVAYYLIHSMEPSVDGSFSARE